MDQSLKNRIRSQKFIDGLTNESPELRKDAREIGTDYLRTRAREDIIQDAILPPDDTLTKDDLDPQAGMESLTKLFNIEPYTPPVQAIAYGSQAEALEIAGKEGMVIFEKLTTPRQRKDKFLLDRYGYEDIRKLLDEFLLYEISQNKDAAFFGTVDALLGDPSEVIPAAGTALCKEIYGGLTPETWKDMMKILPDSNSGFRAKTVVMNQSRAQDLTAWPGDHLSDALLEEVNRRGWVMDEFKGVNLVITIKNHIVENDEIYMFAAPNELGYSGIYDDVTMYSDADGSNLEWWSETVVGCTIQPIGCAKAILKN